MKEQIEKQAIEEMAKVIKSTIVGFGPGNFNFTGEEISKIFAEQLYERNYRKHREGENIATYPTGAFECSICNWSNWDLATGDGAYNYCPNCGAHMKGGAE